MILMVEEYLKVMSNLNRTKVEEINHIEQFEGLKMIFNKLCRSNDFTPLQAKVFDEEITEHSFNDEAYTFIFSLKHFKCLTNHEKEGKLCPHFQTRERQSLLPA